MDGLFNTRPNQQNRVDELVRQADEMGRNKRETLQVSTRKAPWG